MKRRLALVLTGGGARGAYQAGVLRGIADSFPPGAAVPFTIFAGTSAGAINAMALACGADDFHAATERLWNTWANIESASVFRTDAASIAAIAAGWVKDLALGGLTKVTTSNHLLDTLPLRQLLGRELDMPRLEASIRSGRIHAAAVSATNYGSGAAVTFYDADPGVEPWTRDSRVGVRTSLRHSHVMASSAIPMFFPPEAFGGTQWGDGCIRLNAPLSPAIHLGADAILAVGIRRRPTTREMRDLAMRPLKRIAAADVAGALLNAVFLDSLEADFERMLRINRTIELLALGVKHPDNLRVIPGAAIFPSKDLGTLAGAAFESLPSTLRFMLHGIGASKGSGRDLVSYLAFDAAYTGPLLELGRADARLYAAEIAGILGSGVAREGVASRWS